MRASGYDGRRMSHRKRAAGGPTPQVGLLGHMATSAEDGCGQPQSQFRNCSTGLGDAHLRRTVIRAQPPRPAQSANAHLSATSFPIGVPPARAEVSARRRTGRRYWPAAISKSAFCLPAVAGGRVGRPAIRVKLIPSGRARRP